MICMYELGPDSKQGKYINKLLSNIRYIFKVFYSCEPFTDEQLIIDNLIEIFELCFGEGLLRQATISEMISSEDITDALEQIAYKHREDKVIDDTCNESLNEGDYIPESHDELINYLSKKLKFFYENNCILYSEYNTDNIPSLYYDEEETFDDEDFENYPDIDYPDEDYPDEDYME